MTSTTTPPTVEPSAGPSALRVAFTLARREPLAYLFAWLTRVALYTLPIPAGLLRMAVLARVAEGDATPVGRLLAALAVVATARWLLSAFAVAVCTWRWVVWHSKQIAAE